MSPAALLSRLYSASALTQRIITASVLAPLFLLLLYGGGPLFTIMLVSIILLGYHEWIRLSYRSKEKIWPPILEYAAYATLVSVILLSDFVTYGFGFAALLIGSVIVTIIAHFYLEKGPQQAALWAPFGVFYLGLSSLAIVWLRQEGEMITAEPDWAPLVVLVVQVWTTDTFAYIAGRSIGGKKLAPIISPKKTWSGLLGGVMASGLATWGMAEYWGFPQDDMFFFVGALLAIVAQMGDLFESYLKRQAGFKDSGTILPGHGGVLDRIDGLLAAAPIFMMILYAIIKY